jgi:hypothetical protein
VPATFVWFEIVPDSRAGMLSPIKKKIPGQGLQSNIDKSPAPRSPGRDALLLHSLRFIPLWDAAPYWLARSLNTF